MGTEQYKQKFKRAICAAPKQSNPATPARPTGARAASLRRLPAGREVSLRDKPTDGEAPEKTVSVPFSKYGLTIVLMDPDGNVQIRTEEPIPDFCEPAKEPAKWPEPTKEAVKRWASGERGRLDIFPEMG